MGFFIGKYGSPSYINLIFALLVAAVIAFPLALLISFFSLRIKTIFFAMTTLAIAEFSMILAIKLYNFTGGNDGIVLNVPGIFRVSTSLGKFMGIEITGRVITYYFIFLICLLLFLTMLRFINSPLGRTLQAIRDNSQRAEALGNKTFVFQSFSICIGCVVATITGSLYALWVGYVNPDACLDMSIMINVLLMAIIGGVGTLYGGIVGSGFVQIAQTFLPDLQILAKSLFPHAHLLHKAMERWLLIFGVLFILIIFFFPKGIMGSVREYMTHSNTAHSFGCVGPLKRIVSRMLKKSI
jgi:branched-chain amino acid transport system permease protein